MPSRFAVISDTHFVRPPADNEGVFWNRTTERYSSDMGEALVGLIKTLAPDFVIHCGDFTGVDTLENFDYGLSFMNRLGCPWYGVPGNHDAWTSEARSRFRDLFETGDGSWSYSREAGGLRFFFLDVVHWLEDDGSISPRLDREKYDAGRIIGMGPTEKDLAWLDSELESTTMPTVIVTHAPIYFRNAYPLKTLPYGKPVSGAETPPEAFISGFVKKSEGRGRLYDITRKHSAVKACFAGHWHLHDAVVSDDILFVMTASLREFPYEVRMVEFDGSKLVVSTHELDVPKLRDFSYVEEWGNDWVRGVPGAREIWHTLR